jgi:hypothetical protein
MARLVSVSPALRWPFLLALVLVTAFAVVASNLDMAAAETYRVFLIVAPLLPVAGVAVAYGRRADPASEMTMATPINWFGLLMIRAATVLAVAIVFGLVSWPLVPAPASVGASMWLLPALALTLSTLALASRIEMWLSSVMVGGGWAVAITLTWVEGIDAFDSIASLVYTALGVLAGGFVLLNRNAYDREAGG